MIFLCLCSLLLPFLCAFWNRRRNKAFDIFRLDLSIQRLALYTLRLKVICSVRSLVDCSVLSLHVSRALVNREVLSPKLELSQISSIPISFLIRNCLGRLS